MYDSNIDKNRLIIFLTFLLLVFHSYCPSVFLLQSGQTLHIPKGCIHAFRKLSNSPLPPDDCHAALRKQYLEGKSANEEEICISIAWDWAWLGGSSTSTVEQEFNYLSDAASINRDLCIGPGVAHVLSLLQMAERIAHLQAKSKKDLKYNLLEPSRLAYAIYPNLKKVVESEENLVAHCMGLSLAQGRFTVCNKKEAAGYSCSICKSELFNYFWRCRDRNKEEDWCLTCFKGLKFEDDDLRKFQLVHCFQKIEKLKKMLDQVGKIGGVPLP